MKAKCAEFAAAKDVVERLKNDLPILAAALQSARLEADTCLPHCRMVLYDWQTGREDAGADYVIVRKTPGGMIVVRRAGDPSGTESKFRWDEGRYRQAAKPPRWSRGVFELRDVPAEYLPAETQVSGASLNSK
jgi:hypothetical protein